jgi:pimeloyl-ACP methyl ester carboxylesterase
VRQPRTRPASACRRSSTITRRSFGGLDQSPVLIGHSYGGLFVELLLDRGLGRAGVAMSPAPPKGILALPFSTLKAGAPALAHPSKWHGSRH